MKYETDHKEPGLGGYFPGVRRETGKEQMVQVHHDEGVAIHIDPKPCAGVREDVGEASVGERAGQPLSCERNIISGADAVSGAKGKTVRRDIASASPTRRSRRTWHVRKLLAREPGDLWLDRLQPRWGGPHREGEEP